MNWDNIEKILGMYTQFKHYQILFEKYKLPKKISGKEMFASLKEQVTNAGFLEPVISEETFKEWLSYHQIDGNNYSYVYYLEKKPRIELLANLQFKQSELVKINLWDIDPSNESENIDDVMPNLTDTNLIGIHHDDKLKKYIFSFIAPCVVTGKNKDGLVRLYKKIFFAHCVLFEESHYCKIVFNPTTNLLNVNGVEKEDRTDWSPIADLFFSKLQKLIGKQTIKSPNWIPQGLHKLAEEATNHNNPVIATHSFNVEEMVSNFAKKLLEGADIEVETNTALHIKLTQDIQQSFEAQLVEKYGVIDAENSFSAFRQRSDGVTHLINVESTFGLRQGLAAEAARRSRTDNDIDLLGIILKTEDNMYKFLVECELHAYSVRGKNTFIEEEVVNIVIRKLNEYRDEIQSALFNNKENFTGDPIASSQ
ncbi:hypothetical protein [Paenibacillus sp. S29]|uniref:hypothetical protein n=1 Tax=Paenibacillus sp. S29 TaxID=3394611 RepID=UPI0039BF837A